MSFKEGKGSQGPSPVVTIVGCGALGSHVALFLRNQYAGFKLVDFDKVDSKNTEAQFHPRQNVHLNKAEALKRTIQGYWKGTFTATPHRLVDNNVKEILGDSMLVIDCTDNIESRELIQRYCKRMAIPCLHGATAASGDFAQVVWSEHFKPDYEGAGETHTCENGEQLPFFCLAASHIALAAKHFLDTGKRYSLQVTATGVTRIA